MSAIYHTLVYVLFAMIMSILAFKSAKLQKRPSVGNGQVGIPVERKKSKYVLRVKKMDKYLWGIIIFFTVICAIRWCVGTDTLSYTKNFIFGTARNDDDIELAMLWIMRLVTSLGLHFSVGLGILAFLEIYFLVKAFQDDRFILIFVPVLMFGSSYYMDLMNGMRQMIVACGFLWASKFIVEKKPLPYFLFVAAGFLMHKSALLLIPFFFIPNKLKIADKRWVLLTIYLACFVMGMTPQFQGLIQSVEKIAMLLGYEGYVSRVDSYLSGGYSEEALAFGPMQLSYFLIGLFVIWFGPRLKQRYEKRVKCFNLWYFLAYFYSCAFFLVCNISHIFIRPIQYFELFQMAIASLLLYEFVSSYKSKRKISPRTRSYSRMLAIAFSCIIWVNTAWGIAKVTIMKGPGTVDTLTYKVFFMHMDQVRACKNNPNYTL